MFTDAFTLDDIWIILFWHWGFTMSRYDSCNIQTQKEDRSKTLNRSWSQRWLLTLAAWRFCSGWKWRLGRCERSGDVRWREAQCQANSDSPERNDSNGEESAWGMGMKSGSQNTVFLKRNPILLYYYLMLSPCILLKVYFVTLLPHNVTGGHIKRNDV